MRLFWRKHRLPEGNSRGSVEAASFDGSSKPCNDTGPTGALDNGDWDEITEFLSSDGPGSELSSLERSRNAVNSSLGELRASLRQEIVPSGPVLDRLLDVWGLVHQVEPFAAKPVEFLLTSLVARDFVSTKEVTEMCDRVEAALGTPTDRTNQEAQPRRADEASRHVPCRLPSEATGRTTSSEEGAT